ncbi:phosphotransferase family protein [Parasedimentitalea maritima]|uniref:phosphotransferase family protein n=1 Tax=Parasedimentitalea maritima TaxID=2578117 RepID=UPI001FD747E6|nr:phosphotransferase [Zongyanglinia marina]
MTTQNETDLFAHLQLRGLEVENPERLSGGRSNCVWRAGETVVKLYLKYGENPLFANDPKRERASLSALAGTGMVPRLLDAGVFNGHHWLAYSHIEGSIWQTGTPHVAQLLGRLHDQPRFSDLPEGCNGSTSLAAQTRAILARCKTTGHLQHLSPVGQVAPLEKRTLIHGDPVPGNLLEHDGTLTLIDWQCPQLGDPTEDLALFLSPAMQLLYRGHPLTLAEENDFVAAYPDRRVVERLKSLKPWFHWRMAAYCQWKAELGGNRDQEAMLLELDALQSISPKAT